MKFPMLYKNGVLQNAISSAHWNQCQVTNARKKKITSIHNDESDEKERIKWCSKVKNWVRKKKKLNEGERWLTKEWNWLNCIN